MESKIFQIDVLDNCNSTEKKDIENDISIDVDKKDSQKVEYTLEDAFNILGFGKVQLITLFICGITIMAVFNETMGMMIIVPASQCDLNLSPPQKGLLGAIGFIGILLSSHIWGYLADTIGRRKVIVCTLYGSITFTLLSCFVSNFWLFLTIRFCAGICISGPSATIYAYLSEFNSSKHRSTAICWASAFVGVSTAYIPGIAWLVLSQTWALKIYNGLILRPWRLLLFFYTLPGLIAALCLIKWPESPKFLLSRGKEKEALEIIYWLYEVNSKKTAKHFPIKKLKKEEGNLESTENISINKNGWAVLKLLWKQIVPLYKPPYLVNFFICCIVQFGLFFISSGMGLWYPEIQNRIYAMVEHSHHTVCEVIKLNHETNSSEINISQACVDTINTDVFIDSITLGLFYIVGYILLATIINRIGRGIILPLAVFGSGLSGLSLYFVVEPIIIVILFCSFLMLAGMCVAIVNAAVVDLIPTHLRGMAVCISLMIGRSGGVVGSNIIGNLLDINCNLTFFIFSGFIIFCGILTLFLPKQKE